MSSIGVHVMETCFLIIFRYEGDEEYFILVTRDFYETDIPFEKDDYRNDRF